MEPKQKDTESVIRKNDTNEHEYFSTTPLISYTSFEISFFLCIKICVYNSVHFKFYLKNFPLLLLCLSSE